MASMLANVALAIAHVCATTCEASVAPIATAEKSWPNLVGLLGISAAGIKEALPNPRCAHERWPHPRLHAICGGAYTSVLSHCYRMISIEHPLLRSVTSCICRMFLNPGNWHPLAHGPHRRNTPTPSRTSKLRVAFYSDGGCGGYTTWRGSPLNPKLERLSKNPLCGNSCPTPRLSTPTPRMTERPASATQSPTSRRASPTTPDRLASQQAPEGKQNAVLRSQPPQHGPLTQTLCRHPAWHGDGRRASAGCVCALRSRACEPDLGRSTLRSTNNKLYLGAT